MTVRHHIKQLDSLAERLVARADALRLQADRLPDGAERSALLNKAEQMDAAKQLEGWLKSGLQLLRKAQFNDLADE